MTKKNKIATQSEIVTNNGSITIKDVVVADPSIEFSIEIDPSIYKETNDGVFFQNFGAQLSISNLNPDDKGKLTNIGSITVASMASTGAYFYFTFGDSNYIAGTKFTLCILLTAYDPITGKPIDFVENPIYIDVYGSGQPKKKD